MRFKLTSELCYLAGLAGRSRESERSAVGISTQNEKIGDRFINYSIKLGVDPRKILMEEKGTFKHIYYYHSKLSRMIREVLKERAQLARKNRELAIAFIAGTFDANGHVIGNKVTIRRLEKGDELLLELMGVHTVNAKILNIGDFFRLIKSESTLASGMGV